MGCLQEIERKGASDISTNCDDQIAGTFRPMARATRRLVEVAKAHCIVEVGDFKAPSLEFCLNTFVGQQPITIVDKRKPVDAGRELAQHSVVVSAHQVVCYAMEELAASTDVARIAHPT